MTRITAARTLDVRARTSATLAGSDAVHQDPDYSGAYVFLSTDEDHEGVGVLFSELEPDAYRSIERNSGTLDVILLVD